MTSLHPRTPVTASPPRSLPTPCGAPSASPSAIATWRSCWPSAAWSSRTRPSGGGPGSSASLTSMPCAVIGHARATSGTWPRCSCRATACSTTAGGPWTRTGNVLDLLVHARRDALAARKFFRKLLNGLPYIPRVVITDTLASDAAAKRAVLPGVEHRRHNGLNNRAENAHQSTRERERRMKRCKSPGYAQRFLAAYRPIANHFRPRRHRLTATAYRRHRDRANATWREVTGVAAAGSTSCPKPRTLSGYLPLMPRSQVDSALRRSYCIPWCCESAV